MLKTLKELLNREDENNWLAPLPWLGPLEAYRPFRPRNETPKEAWDGKSHDYLLIEPPLAEDGGQDAQTQPLHTFFRSRSGHVKGLYTTTTLDRIMWDKWLRQRKAAHFASLSLMTRDMQGNILLTYESSSRRGSGPSLIAVEPSYYRRTHLDPASQNKKQAETDKEKKKTDAGYITERGISWDGDKDRNDWVVWNSYIVQGAGVCSKKPEGGVEVDEVYPKAVTDSEAKEQAEKPVRKLVKCAFEQIQRDVAKRDKLPEAERAKKVELDKWREPKFSSRFIYFRRCFVLLHHSCRPRLATLPMLCRDLFELSGYEKEDRANVKIARDMINGHWEPAAATSEVEANVGACAALYWCLCKKKKDWITAVGEPMCQNLEQLSSVLADESRRVVLVTGLSGTGKENYSRALHFAGKPWSGEPDKTLIVTTAGDLLDTKIPIADAIHTKYRHGVSAIRENESGTLIIDELNKAADSVSLSKFLRVLEDPDGELGTRGHVQTILAASEHLEKLAQTPPQDFWTRVSNQIRVVHPLGRVPEKDAYDFLRAFFWWEWWKLISKRMEKAPRDSLSHRLAAEWLGGLWRDSPSLQDEEGKCPSHVFRSPDNRTVADIVCEEFVSTVTPLANRDEVSVRGVRSMVSQVYSRVIWAFGHRARSALTTTLKAEQDARMAVNRAIQDVLAILNAARSTARSTGGDKSTKRQDNT